MEISINLIPPHKREEIFQAKRLRLVFRLQMDVILIGLIFFASLWGSRHVLNLNFDLVSSEGQQDVNQEKYRKIDEYDQEFRRINSELKAISLVKGDQLYWSKMFRVLNKDISSGISLDEVSTKNYAVFISGKAIDRDTLIIFRDKLATEECFSSVDLPLSNLVSKDNVAFQMDLAVKPECLKSSQ